MRHDCTCDMHMRAIGPAAPTDHMHVLNLIGSHFAGLRSQPLLHPSSHAALPLPPSPLGAHQASDACTRRDPRAGGGVDEPARRAPRGDA